MPFWGLYYHIVWVTHERRPLIDEEIEQVVYQMVVSKSEMQGALVYAVNGMPDHVHMVAGVPPSVSLSAFIKAVKGSTSRFVEQHTKKWFAWQSGYGAFSVGPSGLETVIDYVRNQKTHHQTNDVIDLLEYATSKQNGPG